MRCERSQISSCRFHSVKNHQAVPLRAQPSVPIRLALSIAEYQCVGGFAVPCRRAGDTLIWTNVMALSTSAVRREVPDVRVVVDSQRQPISAHSERHLNQSIFFIRRLYRILRRPHLSPFISVHIWLGIASNVFLALNRSFDVSYTSLGTVH